MRGLSARGAALDRPADLSHAGAPAGFAATPGTDTRTGTVLVVRARGEAELGVALAALAANGHSLLCEDGRVAAAYASLRDALDAALLLERRGRTKRPALRALQAEYTRLMGLYRQAAVVKGASAEPLLGAVEFTERAVARKAVAAGLGACAPEPGY